MIRRPRTSPLFPSPPLSRFIVKLGVDSRLSDDDNDPALLAALKDAIAYADAHPDEAKSIDEVRALIPQWISESKSKTDRKSTRLNSSHLVISYAVFCLKKKK